MEAKRKGIGATVSAAEYAEVREWLDAVGVPMKSAVLRGLGALMSGEVEIEPPANQSIPTFRSPQSKTGRT